MSILASLSRADEPSGHATVRSHSMGRSPALVMCAVVLAGVEFPGSSGQLLASVMEGGHVHARECRTSSHDV